MIKNVVIFAIICTSILFSTKISASSNPNTYLNINEQNELKTINEKISALEEELQTLRKFSFNKEMEAQPHMIDNWEQFTDEIKSSEEGEKQIILIKKQIEKLNEQKKKSH